MTEKQLFDEVWNICLLCEEHFEEDDTEEEKCEFIRSVVKSLLKVKWTKNKKEYVEEIITDFIYWED